MTGPDQTGQVKVETGRTCGENVSSLTDSYIICVGHNVMTILHGRFNSSPFTSQLGPFVCIRSDKRSDDRTDDSTTTGRMT